MSWGIHLCNKINIIRVNIHHEIAHFVNFRVTFNVLATSTHEISITAFKSLFDKTKKIHMTKKGKIVDSSKIANF